MPTQQSFNKIISRQQKKKTPNKQQQKTNFTIFYLQSVQKARSKITNGNSYSLEYVEIF